MIEIGPLIAAGRTSDVYALGDDSVIKVPRADIPRHWAAIEAELTIAVHGQGVPAPAVRDLVVVDGRDAVVFERVQGPSMLELVRLDPPSAPTLAREMATLQAELHAAGVPLGVPPLVERMTEKIGEARRLSEAERREAVADVSAMPRGASLLHGDLHPGNVLVGAGGPVLIDWFDAAVGHPDADIVRSSLLLRRMDDRCAWAAGTAQRPGLLTTFHDAYLATIRDVTGCEPHRLRRWDPLVAVSRLAEGIPADDDSLLAIWRDRRSPTAGPFGEPPVSVVDVTDQEPEVVEHLR